MNHLAQKIDSIVEYQDNLATQQDCEIVEVDFRDRESLSANFNAEIEAWARHSLAANGFGDY